MGTNIVQLNVSQTFAPTPSTLQQTGAFITQGGTTLTPQNTAILTQLSDLTPLLVTASATTALSWTTGTVTVTTAGPLGITSGTVVNITIAGVVPAGYNGTFGCTITGTNTFTYPLATNPGGISTTQGTWIPAAVAQLQSMATTFFAQGSSVQVQVLELGYGTPAQGVTALSTYEGTYPSKFYSYLVPREWATETTFQTFVTTYEANTAKKYFFVTLTPSIYTAYPMVKSVVKLIEAPTIPATEFTLAAVFWQTLHYNPSSTNQVTPLCFSYMVGVTPYPITGPLQTNFKTNNVNYITTGAEGGISNTMLVWGHTSDGNPFNYWYSVDWVQINLELALANEIINGSNNPLAPLYFNQQGINRLQARSISVMVQAIANGLALGSVKLATSTGTQFANDVGNGVYAGFAVVNAVPFANYNQVNPSDYSIGKYSGLSAVYTPARGFEQIIFNLNVTNFAG